MKPTLIHGPMPIVNTVGSPSTRHSIATRSSSVSGPRSLLWATHRWPSADAAGVATRSEQRPTGSGTGASSSMEAANTAAGSQPAPSATPSSSSTSHGSSSAVTAR